MIFMVVSGVRIRQGRLLDSATPAAARQLAGVTSLADAGSVRYGAGTAPARSNSSPPV